MLCPYCGEEARLVKGNKIYPHIAKLYNSNYYLCEDCKAYVGCHKDSIRPLGTPANAELRKARAFTHRIFDRIWRENKMTRRQAYIDLAECLDIDMSLCHIGQFGLNQCSQAIKFAMYYKV